MPTELPPGQTSRNRRKQPRTAPPIQGHASGEAFSRPAHRPAAKLRRMRRTVLYTLVCVLAVESGIALLTSPKLSIKRVEVRGTEALPAAEADAVKQAVKLSNRTNWFRAPVQPLETRLRALPCVRTATVSRRFPDGLRADIALREPVLVAQIGTASYEVDADSVPIRAARPAAAARLPLVVLMRSRPIQPRIALNDLALNAAMQTLQSARREPAIQIAKIEVDLTDNICLNMRDGIRISCGSVDDWGAKLDLLQAIYRREPTIAQRVTAIDLTSPNYPACKPRLPEPPKGTDTTVAKTMPAQTNERTRTY